MVCSEVPQPQKQIRPQPVGLSIGCWHLLKRSLLLQGTGGETLFIVHHLQVPIWQVFKILPGTGWWTLCPGPVFVLPTFLQLPEESLPASPGEISHFWLRDLSCEHRLGVKPGEKVHVALTSRLDFYWPVPFLTQLQNSFIFLSTYTIYNIRREFDNS